jgi:P pilus assembly chaperone PapD
MIKKILGLFTALMIIAEAHASIAVAPMRLEINANKVKGNYLTTSINVRGDNKKPMRFKVTKGYFTLNERGELNMVEDTETNDPHDISKNVKFVPSEFNVMPGKEQRVRINVVNLNQLPDGESRAILFIEDVDPKELEIPTGRAGYGAQLIVKTRLGVPIYVDRGKVVKTGEIEYLKITKEKDGLYTNMKINSTGNSRIRYSGKVQIVQGKKLIDEYNIDGHPVPHGKYYIAKDKIKADKVARATGEYTLRVTLSYDDGNGKKQHLKQEIPFKVN